MRSNKTNHDQFAQLFVRHQASVYRYIVTLVPNRADADELFQEANLTLWRKWEQFDTSREFLPWACGIALNHVRNFWRKRREVAVVFDEDLLNQLTQLRLCEDQLFRDRQKALGQCLEELTPRKRQLLEQYYGGLETVKSIAEGEGRRVNAVYKTLERIRTMLHQCIDRRLAAEG